MSGLAEYIRWLGRFSFAELPFCEADALILCVISYFDLSPILRGREDGAVRIADCGPCAADGAVSLLLTGNDLGNGEIFRAAIESKRFGALRITAYEDVFDPDAPLQFSALTFRDDDGFAFIAFRGTDETIAGWKEDFMISFTQTDAQKLAAAYAERVMGSCGRFYIGGHSKGANLALCAAGALSEEAWERVERVFLLDGPGLCPEVAELSVLRRIDAKATRILPEFDVVGKLFEPAITDTRIIRSSAGGILQHSLATWQVEYGELALAPEHDRHSVALMSVLNRWIAGLSMADRRRVTEELFSALAADGAVTLRDIADGGPRSFEAVLWKMFHTSEETKKLLLDLPAQALAALRRRFSLPEA